MSGACLRCGRSLESAQVDDLAVRMCPPCSSMLIRHDDLLLILDQSWRAVSPEVAGNEPLHLPPPVEVEPNFSCPDCGRSMEKYGYMGMTRVMMDRCDSCSLVWLDANELQNIVLVYARNQYRTMQRQNEARRTDLDILASGMMGAAMPVVSKRNLWLWPETGASGNDMAPLAMNLLLLLLRR